MHPDLLSDILPQIALYLDPAHTARIARLSSQTWHALAPSLYSNLTFASDDALHAFLVALDPRAAPDEQAKDRRTRCLNYSRFLHLDALPSTRTCTLILAIADQTTPLHRVFPRVGALSLHPNVVASLPSHVPSISYNASKSAIKAYEALRRLSRPTTLTITIPSVPRPCPAYREMHTYFLSQRTDKRNFFLHLRDHLPELEVVEWGHTHLDDTYAVLGVSNVYTVPECDCVRDEKYHNELFRSFLDWGTSTLDLPFPRVKVELQGPQKTITVLQRRLSAHLADEYLAHPLPQEAMFAIEAH